MMSLCLSLCSVGRLATTANFQEERPNDGDFKFLVVPLAQLLSDSHAPTVVLVHLFVTLEIFIGVANAFDKPAQPTLGHDLGDAPFNIGLHDIGELAATVGESIKCAKGSELSEDSFLAQFQRRRSVGRHVCFCRFIDEFPNKHEFVIDLVKIPLCNQSRATRGKDIFLHKYVIW